MRRLFLIFVLILLIGCKAPQEPLQVNQSRQAAQRPVFLVDEIPGLQVLDFNDNPLPGQAVRLDMPVIGDTMANALAVQASDTTPGSFRWTGKIEPESRLTCLIGIANAPPELFNVFGLIPPILRYGRHDIEPIPGVKFAVFADGDRVFELELPREDLADHWTPIAVSLEEHAGENIELTFKVEGIVSGANLPYWAHPEIVAPQANPRRVIILGLDTTAAGHVGWMGYNRPTTANLDKLARQSTIFMDAHSCSPWTLPSFSSALSGRPPGVTGADRRNRGLSQHEDMLAEIFRRNGFATASFLNIPYLQEAGFYQGVDHKWEVQDQPSGKALTQAKNWIEYHKEQDFFIFIHLFEPHIAYVPPEHWRAQFCNPNYRGEHKDKWHLPSEITRQNRLDPSVWASFSDADKRQCMDLYDAEIAAMDEYIGQFFDWYKEAGLFDNTMLIVLGDHGEEFGQHGRWEHGHSQYEEQIHVPFFIKLPGQLTSRRVEGLVGTIDIKPTLLEMFGFTSETESWGESLVPVLRGDAPNPDYRLIAEQTRWGPEIKAVVTNQYKYILHFGTGEEELYNLQADPDEKTNVIDEHQDAADDLSGYLENYVNRTQAGWHLRFLAGPNAASSVNVIIRSESAIENSVFIDQIFNGSGGVTRLDPNTIRVELDLAILDIVEVQFTINPPDGFVTFSGLIDGKPASDMILLGSFMKPLGEIAQMLSGVEAEIPPGLGAMSESGALTITEDDPVIAFSFPDYARQDDRGVYLWTMPQNLRAHETVLTPEQQEALESLGYITE